MTILGRVNAIAEEVSIVHNEVKSDLANLKRVQRSIETKLRILSTSPARRPGTTLNLDLTGDTEYQERPAVLCHNPKTLELLWREYVVGIAGSKPACDFSRRERGRCKHKYCQRNVLWKVMARLIEKQGLDCSTAVRRIKSVYGLSLIHI